MFLRLKLNIRKFFQKHNKKILIIIILWSVILVINYILGHRPKVEQFKTSYTPHTSVLKNEKVPDKLQGPIERLIDKFITLCNNKNYNEAYGLLSDECKKSIFENSIDNFKEYVDTVFETRKIYGMQDYSNYDGMYIYSVKILDDILSTGLTDQEYAYYEEKYTIKQDGDKLYLNICNYIKEDDIKRIAEDDYSKVRILNRKIYYDKEYYTINITNKTDNIMLIGNGTESDEILLDVGTDMRNIYNSTYNILLNPGETKEFIIYFGKYFDEGETSSSIVFNKIRLLNEYSGDPEKYDDEINNAVKTYSLTIPLK